ncbi:Serine protease 42 [Orchesella cincta]|uniref:Phenoloxidase-activating factor 2 n=1 Tax=Orchesella cincta TaxID=48709 RepID=A0A1D2N5F5_ORCCI|nr:Serine protease 42 [Orchesella cincta]
MFLQFQFVCLVLVVLNIQLMSVSSVPQSSRSVLRRTLANPQGQLNNAHQRHRKVLRQAVGARKLSNPPGACECMDYWECVSNNGHVYSYCGISDSEVCCFHKDKDGQFNSNNNDVGSVRNDVTTSAPLSSSSSSEDFTTGNRNPPTDFVTATPSTITGSSFADVDYFFSLEDGVGDLKRITVTATDQSPTEASTINVENVEVNGRLSSCGTQAVQWNLDSKAQFREWPWHVAILEVSQDLYICGGSLVNENTVITAAHCVNSYVRRNAQKLKVRAGEYDVSTNDEPDPYAEVTVEKIAIHPDFNNATLFNDIAVIKLSKPLNFSSNIRPVCLPSNKNPLDRNASRRQCVVTGWGRVSETSPFSIVLKEIVVPTWGYNECETQLRKNFGTSYKLPETAVCAGETGHDACDGDGGGGLVCYDQERKVWELVGTVSFGIGCGRGNTPGVYTNVGFYNNWVNSV